MEYEWFRYISVSSWLICLILLVVVFTITYRVAKDVGRSGKVFTPIKLCLLVLCIGLYLYAGIGTWAAFLDTHQWNNAGRAFVSWIPVVVLLFYLGKKAGQRR